VKERGKRWLARPSLPWLAALVAVLLSATALGNGFIADDHFLRGTALGLNPPALSVASRFDLFRFYPDDPAQIARWQELGIAPWWMPLDCAISFLRPLSSAFHALDFALWPDSAVAMHLHSLLWLAASVLAFHRLAARFEARPWVLGLATTIFAVDAVHAIPIGWIANRNTLLAGFFSILALYFHDRARREHDRWAGLGSVVSLALGLASGEIALGTLGFFVAHAWTFERGMRRRAFALMPAIITVVAWRAVYVLLGYTTRRSGLYIDPLRSPFDFVKAAADRIPRLFFAQLGGFASDFYPMVSAEIRLALGAVAVVGSCLLLYWLRRLLVRDELSRFWLVGLGLSLVPSAATFPNDRLLFVASIGAAPLVARALAEAGASVGKPAAWVLGLVHLVLSPASLPWRVASMREFGRIGADMARAIPGDLTGRTLVVVNAPESLWCVQLFTAAASQGIAPPARLRCMGATSAELEVFRESEQSLLLRPKRSYFTAPLDGLLRAAEVPWKLGSQGDLSVISFEVTRLGPDGKPDEVRARYHVPMSSPELVSMVWDGRKLVPFTPPAIGETARFPGSDLLALVTGAAR